MTGDGKTSLRAGYGLFYDKPNTITTNSAATQGPFGTVARADGNAANSLRNTWAGSTNPFPVDIFNVPADAPVVLPFNAFSYAENMRPGKMHSWHVTGEREIFKATMLRVAYAGSRGEGLTIGLELNPATYVEGATTATTNQRRPLFPNYGNITSIEPRGKSTYHSLQLTIDKRLSGGLSVLSNYTLSKSMDNTSANKQNGSTAVNPYDLSYDWGPANADRRHRWVTSVLWQIPGQFDNGALQALLGGLEPHGYLHADERSAVHGRAAAWTTPAPAPAVSSPIRLATRSSRATGPRPSSSPSGSTPRRSPSTPSAPSATPAATRCAVPTSRCWTWDCTRRSRSPNRGQHAVPVRGVQRAEPHQLQSSRRQPVIGQFRTHHRGVGGRRRERPTHPAVGAPLLVLRIDACRNAHSMTEASGPPSLTGLFAAAVTPRTDAGAVDHAAFDRVLDLLLAADVDGVCLGGATAEYPHATLR